ncbi:MAG: NeuD/PglB/VioB family sugar acetyltransferase [Actinobacteria bacterium]|nr:NeuD/PglB/VioB family sugar acetyltransferase [Actinomycetota bacterium]MCG2800440.1 NeuD/PglB/VioB family sugar acetyltransferase [Cellulomonas sp.]
MQTLVLVAASGLAREVLALLREHPAYECIGFLDDSLAGPGATVDGLPVLGTIEEAGRWPEAQLLVCAGRGVVRRAIVSRLTAAGVGPQRYATVVHPRIEVPDGCRVGQGSILLAGAVLTTAVEVGEHVVVMPNVTLTHDDVIEDYATLCAGVALGGGVVVGPGAYLGMSSSVREGRRVGSRAILGMGSVLLQDLPDDQVWAGVPARPLSPRAPQ